MISWPDPGWLMVLLPLIAAPVLAAIPRWRTAAWGNVAVSAATLAVAAWLVRRGPVDGGTLLCDRLALHGSLLTALIAATTSVASLGEELELRDRGRLRLYHALYQGLVGGMLLALLSGNAGLTCLAIETVIITGALAVGLSRTTAAALAAQKYFMLCGVAVAFALLGTVVLSLAAQPALGPGIAGLGWRPLLAAAARCNGPLLSIAFMFLLTGAAALAGLVPLHGWLADAAAVAPAPIVTILSGAGTVTALCMILRLHGILGANPHAMAPGPPIVALGLASVLLGAAGLWGKCDQKHFVAFATIAQGGVAAYAFGLGGDGPVFAGLLHMTALALVKPALHGARGVLLAVAFVAIAGFPPFGLFSGAFMLATASPVTTLPLAAGLALIGWACLRRLPALHPGSASPTLNLLPAAVSLGIAAVLGVAMPGAIAAWFAAIAEASR